jgi:hypothetical protein
MVEALLTVQAPPGHPSANAGAASAPPPRTEERALPAAAGHKGPATAVTRQPGHEPGPADPVSATQAYLTADIGDEIFAAMNGAIRKKFR